VPAPKTLPGNTDSFSASSNFFRELFVIFEESADIYLETGLDLDSIAAAVVGGGVYNVANLLH